MISVEFTEQEAVATIEFMKRALSSVPPTDPNYDGAVDAYVQLRNKIKTGQPVKPKKAPAK